MASNARFIFENRWDDCSLTLLNGDETSSLPLSNTQRYNNSRVYRSESLADLSVKADIGFGAPVSGLVLWRHNLTEAAEVRVRTYSDLAQTELTHDTGWSPAIVAKTLGELKWGTDPLGASAFTNWRLKYSVYWLPVTTTSSVRLDVRDPGNPDGFLEIGRIYMGQYFEPRYNIDLGHSISWDSNIAQNTTAGGSIHTIETEGFRVLSFNLSHIQDIERADLFEATRRVLKHEDIFVSLVPEQGGAKERDYSFAAKLVDVPSFDHQVGRYTNKFKVREV